MKALNKTPGMFNGVVDMDWLIKNMQKDFKH